MSSRWRSTGQHLLHDRRFCEGEFSPESSDESWRSNVSSRSGKPAWTMSLDWSLSFLPMRFIVVLLLMSLFPSSAKTNALRTQRFRCERGLLPC
jgi:hypothetical protein